MDFFDFISQSFGDLSSFINAILDFLARLVDLLVRLFSFIWRGLLAVANYAVTALEKVAGFFKHLWENFFKNIFTHIVDAIRKVHTWLEAHLRPIINWLKKAQVWLERHVWAPLRQYIQFLQRLRRWLTILRFLHIKWAEALDRRLAQAEAQTARVFLTIRGLFNQVISWVNAASDPLRLGRMILFASVGRRSAGALCRLFTGLPLGVFFPHTGKGSHLWEQPLLSVQDLNDPKRNPPASQILLGLSPIPVDGFASDDPTPSDADLDSLETVPYFDDLSSWWFASAALFDGMDSPRISITDTIAEQKGNLADAGKVIGDWLKDAVEV